MSFEFGKIDRMKTMVCMFQLNAHWHSYFFLLFLEKHRHWILNVAAERLEPCGTDCTVDDALHAAQEVCEQTEVEESSALR